MDAADPRRQAFLAFLQGKAPQPSYADLSALLDALEREDATRPPGRWQDALILDTIPPGSHVLDLGCGEGDLLAALQRQKGVVGQGVEIDAHEVITAIARGVNVIQGDLDTDLLSHFPALRFDWVVLEATLPALYYPIEILDNMLRVGRNGIISFPNYGHWRMRLSLLLDGRKPITPSFPHRWFDAPNIHPFALDDILEWARGGGARLVQAWTYADGTVRPMQDGDNRLAEEALLIVQRSGTVHEG